MKKAMKIIGIAAGVVLGLLLLLVLAIKVLITPEGVKKTAIPLVEKRLHRQVRVGDVKVSLFSGILLDDLAIMEKEGNEPFVKAGRVKLRYQFWPLLSKRVVIDEVQLDAPQIRVIRLADGTFNYSDITAAKEKPPEAKAEKGQINLVVSKIALTKGVVYFEDRKQAPPFATTISGIEFSGHDIALDRPFPFTAKASIPGLTVSADGKAADVAAHLTIDAVIKVTDVDLRKLVVGLPPSLAAKAKKFDPAGSVSATLHLAGPVSAGKAMLKEGTVRLSKVEATVSGERPALSGDIEVKPDAASSRNLEIVLGSNKAAIAFNAADLFGKTLRLSSSITADRFDLDPFLKKGGAKGEQAPPASAEKPEPGPLDLPVRATGTAQVGQTVYKGLPITKLYLKYRLEQNVLTVEQLSGNVAGGSFSDTARIDLNRKGFVYSTRLKVQGVQAEKVVPAFAPKAAGTVYGTLSLDADLNGKGTKSAAMKKNLSGRGSFAIANGKLTGAGLVQGLAQFINVEQLRVLQFNRFDGTFRIVNGKVLLDSGVSGKDVQITPKGTAGLDKSLDLSLMTRLSPALTGSVARGEVGKLVTDDKGWGILPLKVTGTFSSPRFRLDTALMGEQLKTKAREKLQQTIQEKLFRKKEGEPRQPEQELIEKGLKGVFGK